VRIVHVLANARRAGGAETYALAALAAQERAGNDVAVLHMDFAPELNGTPQHRATESGAALDWANAFAPDVVHVHGSPLDRALEEQLQARYPLIRSLHDYAQTCATGQLYLRDGGECPRSHGNGCLSHMLVHGCAHRADLRPAFRSHRRITERLPLLQAADAVLVYSDFVRDNVLRNGIEPDRCRVIPYFARRAEAPPPPSSERAVAFVGRVSAAKGLDVLIRALARERDAWTRLQVIGDGWHRAECERLAEQLGVAGRIDWLGWLDEEGVAAAIRNARIVVMPSRWPEPFGIVGIEAMAQGRAVVASRSGGIPEWLDDGETGVLVRPGDDEALAGAIRNLLDDPERAARLGTEGWRRVERFSPESHVAQLQALYEEVA
jgi:glycosyltransferase involved in cell wall biosynthesis